MRILHVLGKLDRGGAETWLVQVLRHIDRSKYQFDFVVHTEEPGAFDDEVRALGARVIPCLSPSSPVRYARNFRRILKEYGPYDCVHSHVHHFSGYVLALAKIAGVASRIAHSHTAHHEMNASSVRRSYLRMMQWLIEKHSTTGIAVSGEAAASLFIPRVNQKWVVQPLGIDLDVYEQPVNRVAVRQTLGIAQDAFVVGHVGRFVEAKNHEFLVEIAAEAVKLRDDVVFLLVGDGPLRVEIERLVAERGLTRRFVFAGLRKDVPSLLASMDTFLFPSLYEGFPLSVVEAQAAGLTCLLSDAITKDVDAVRGLVTRMPIEAGAKAWASALSTAHSRSKASDDLRADLCGHTIDAAVGRLCGVYESA